MPTKTFSTILVATDFSDGSDEALAMAIELAGQLGAKLELVHVYDAGLDQFPFGIPYVIDAYPRPRPGAPPYVERALSERAARVRRAGLSCDTMSIEGSADLEITRRAAELGADLIVVGTHGRTGLAHVVMGSIAERVVQHAGRPVLTVPFSRKAA